MNEVFFLLFFVRFFLLKQFVLLTFFYGYFFSLHLILCVLNLFFGVLLLNMIIMKLGVCVCVWVGEWNWVHDTSNRMMCWKGIPTRRILIKSAKYCSFERKRLNNALSCNNNNRKRRGRRRKKEISVQWNVQWGQQRKNKVLHSMFVFSLAKTTSHSNITNTHTQNRKNKKNKFMGFSLGISYSFFLYVFFSFLLKNEHWNEVAAQNFTEVDLVSLNSLFHSSVLFEERCADSLWIRVSFHNQQLFQIFHQQ